MSPQGVLQGFHCTCSLVCMLGRGSGGYWSMWCWCPRTESHHLQLDETTEKVRAVPEKRCVLILREIPKDTPQKVAPAFCHLFPFTLPSPSSSFFHLSPFLPCSIINLSLSYCYGRNVPSTQRSYLILCHGLLYSNTQARFPNSVLCMYM